MSNGESQTLAAAELNRHAPTARSQCTAHVGNWISLSRPSPIALIENANNALWVSSVAKKSAASTGVPSWNLSIWTLNSSSFNIRLLSAEQTISENYTLNYYLWRITHSLPCVSFQTHALTVTHFRSVPVTWPWYIKPWMTFFFLNEYFLSPYELIQNKWNV